jgi:5-methylcytosine-specific restriction endonuclease McrA
VKHTVLMKDVHISSYANLVLLQQVYTQLENRRWAKERKSFLMHELSTKGKLVCHYCMRDLKLKAPKRHEQATVDHIVPKSVGGDPYSHSNFVVCCNSCNQRKGSHSALNFSNGQYIKNKIQTNKNL